MKKKGRKKQLLYKADYKKPMRGGEMCEQKNPHKSPHNDFGMLLYKLEKR